MIIYPFKAPKSLRSEVPQRRPDMTIGAVPSRKLQRMVRYTSLLKRACIYLLEHDTQVTSYQERPLTLSFSHGGNEASFTPDFSVCWQHREPWLMMCQSETIFQSTQSHPMWTAGHLWCSQHSYTFVVLTDTTLRRQGALLANLEMLAVHAHQQMPPQVREYLLRTIANIHDPWTFNELLPLIPHLSPERAISYLWYLLYSGEVVTDLTHLLEINITRFLWKEITNETNTPK